MTFQDYIDEVRDYAFDEIDCGNYDTDEYDIDFLMDGLKDTVTGRVDGLACKEADPEIVFDGDFVKELRAFGSPYALYDAFEEGPYGLDCLIRCLAFERVWDDIYKKFESVVKKDGER